MELTATRHGPTDPALGAILSLIRAAFADMDGKIDPPSSMHRLTLDAVKAQADRAEIWSIGAPPNACVFLTPKQDRLYLGKLAVSAHARGQGMARRLVDLAENRASALGLPQLELQTRIELTKNHAVFQALGFTECGRTSHPGYKRPTSITYCRPVGTPSA